MILLYSHSTSSRLQYTCSFIFKELMGIEYHLVNKVDEFNNFIGPKINYSNAPKDEKVINIPVQGLLFETGIHAQTIACFEQHGFKYFFKGTDEDYPFDIFSAIFYLLSRYEEYLPHTKDLYGRYAHENSLAFKEGFLQQPLINTWLNDFAKAIKNKFPSFSSHQPAFTFLPTYDIDIAFSYKHKGLQRNIGGFLKSPSIERISVLLGLKKDPFDIYEWLDNLHQQYKLHPVYFFLLAKQNGAYDKNILPSKKELRLLIQQQALKNQTGIHPSWQSGDDFSLLKNEKIILQSITGKPVSSSRQHYIRFNLPVGYQRLIEAGITDDFSMGYGSINGFRASVASSFFWYDLANEKETNLRIHPFCFMEANSFYEQHFSPQQAKDELMHYYKVCKKVNGTLITIWHNNFFGTDKQFAGWKQLYQQFIAQVQQ
jgi:hypothetical protein